MVYACRFNKNVEHIKNIILEIPITTMLEENVIINHIRDKNKLHN